MAKNDFQHGGWNSFTLQCVTWLWDDMTLNSLGGSTLQCYTWLCRWHAIEFLQTSAILEFYFRFRLWPYNRCRHVILHQSAKFYTNRTAHGRKMTSCRFSYLKSPCTTSYRSYFLLTYLLTIALNCIVFEKIAFLILHFSDKIQDGGSPPSWILGIL